MINQDSYARAIIDFQNARRKADMQDLLSLLTGHSTELLSYEEVRQKLRAIEGSRQELQDIPINAIIGSVGRYTDFNKNFLPLHEFDQDRWSRIMVEATDSVGLPPIEVYQIGEAYFVLDGNHRVSVAKELGATHIQAYVTEVKTKIPVTPDLEPDDLIIKAEYINFLEKTDLNILRQESDLTVTAPGRYPVFLEHIAVHQYFMGIDEEREIPYSEAVTHWYDYIYLPVVEIIKERGILRFFPDRTEADMYIWLAKHQEALKNDLGWQFETEIVADDLISQYAAGLKHTVSHVTSRLLDVVTPDGLEAGPPTGQWREQQVSHGRENCLFRDILVAISKDDLEWQALHQALEIAHKENAVLRGLHVIPGSEQFESAATVQVIDEFKRRCAEANISGDIAVEVGSAARKICERAQWTDLVIGKLTHPPKNQLLGRLSSGFRILVRRSSRPILAVPETALPLKKALLAYNGSPKADEALFISAYMASRWRLPLIVLTIQTAEVDAEAVQVKAREYLNTADVLAEHIIIEENDVVDSILQTAQEQDCSLILIGGYKASPVIEIVKGSLVDQLLRETTLPTLICR
jgi:nucleotide-binding universal stress UspA family protein